MPKLFFNIFLSFFLLLLLPLFFCYQVHAAPACPLPFDTKVFTDPKTGLCYSESDPLYNPGFNTVGGTKSVCGTIGQVRCPGDHTSPFPDANACVAQVNGQCYAGKGPSGFDTPGCTPADITKPLPQCPVPMNLTVQVSDSTGNGINNITITVMYADAPPGTAAGKTATAVTDPLGTAVIKGALYSGDHFIITPSSPYYTFTPASFGSNQNIGTLEMNTNNQYSCGTALENGARPPCKFTALRNNVPFPTSPPGTAPLPTAKPTFDDTTVNDTTSALAQTMYVMVGVGAIGYVVMAIGGNGKLW